MSAAALLDRLEGVRESGPGRWIAKCSAHDDRNPSLSIRETSDGTVLIKCWAGCGVADIVAAVGLELRDLFPPCTDHHQRPLRPRERWYPRDLLLILRREALVVLIAARDIAAGRPLSDEDSARLLDAVTRIEHVVGAAS